MPQKEKLLVLDASVTVQKLVHLTFAETAFEVITAVDANDAIQKLRTIKPSLLFTDTESLASVSESLKESAGDDSSAPKIVLFISGQEIPPADVTIHGILKKPFQARDLKELTLSLLRKNEDLFRSRSEETQSTVIVENRSETSSQLTQVTETAVRTPPQNEEQGITASLAESFDALAREEIQKWIHAEMPALAQRLLREEIEKRLLK